MTTKQRTFFKETDCHTINYYLYEPLVVKIAPLFKKLNIHPNYVSIFRIILSIIFLYFMLKQKDWIFKNKIPSICLVIFVYFIFGLTDDLDGYMARKYNLKSKVGNILDKLADKIVVLLSITLYVYYNLNKTKNMTVIFLLFISFYSINFINNTCTLVHFNLDHFAINAFILCLSILIN